MNKLTGYNLDTPYSFEIERTRKHYFDYLCDLVNIGGQKAGSYYILAEALYDKEYYWSVENDGNRENDGYNLRYSWWNEEGFKDPAHCLDALCGPCTVLEMLIALAIRMEDSILYDVEKGSRVDIWFFDMIRNLGLEEATDENNEPAMIEAIDYAVDTLLDRKYDRHGQKGGLFPVHRLSRGKDMRKMEIWFQMHAYIQEKRLV